MRPDGGGQAPECYAPQSQHGSVAGILQSAALHWFRKMRESFLEYRDGVLREEEEMK